VHTFIRADSLLVSINGVPSLTIVATTIQEMLHREEHKFSTLC
jgi:hypothetical protein